MLELVSKLNQWLEAQRCMKGAEESLQDCHQQMALVKEAEAHGPSGQHPLYTLATRYAKHHRAHDAQEKARTALREKIEDCEKHLNLHKVIKTPDNIFRMITPYFCIC
jgi:PI-3-kinase-related kinase SMG-1